ncbi:Respiratory supercomplex factor 1, mitochondrial [Entomophthora muscae]|uniref:Respiratory supercomplex factor 1, mitochondrial n=1 Tax=Entomophthora muscae TaxID=34485 RepID=A0ACC2T335_9FUNG|nr:Respiratory supercomplex factor 1, mitochondrial [Entomophthora muscae]
MSSAYESTIQRLKRKSMEQPWVPLGCVLTIGAFLSAYRNFRTGSREQGVVMLRYRVAFQGLTVVGILLGSAIATTTKDSDRPPIKPRPAFESTPEN